MGSRLKVLTSSLGLCGLAVLLLAWPEAASAAVSAPASPGAATLPTVTLPVHLPLAAPAAPAPSSAPAPVAPRAAAAGGSQLIVQPDSNLTDGQNVQVTASGMKPNAYGSVLECNLTNGEPTVQVEGNAVPVGCTNPLNTIQSTDASGGFTKTFTVHTGTIGPPGQGTDSAGKPASQDAANYPCPPTPAQQSAGGTCDMVFGDTSGDQATTPITFASSSSGHSSSSSAPASAGSAGASSGSGTSGGPAGSTGPDTAAGSSSDPGGTGSSGGTLPFTGFGGGMQLLLRLGALFFAGGLLLLVVPGALRAGLGRRRPPVGYA